jgi:hypothetical protein
MIRLPRLLAERQQDSQVVGRRVSRTGALGPLHNAVAHQTELLGRRLSAAGTLGGPVGLGLDDRPEVALDDNGDGLVVWPAPGSPWRRPRSRPAPSLRPGSSAPPG